MKEDLKAILYMGLGAVSETNEKMQEVKDTLYQRGKELYEKGIIANEELKHNINDMMSTKDDNKNHEKSCYCNSDDIVRTLKNLSKEEQIKIMNKMGWTDVNNEKGAERD